MTKEDTRQQSHGLVKDQAGLVSMIVVVLLMTIISIITLSYSSVVRNEQRQTIDRQLNTQAHYAAESGINYARSVIDDKLKNGDAGVPVTISDPKFIKDSCGPQSTPNFYTDPLTFADGVTVTCLLIDSSPPSLVYDLDTTTPSKIFPIKPQSAITTIQVEWTRQSGDVNGCPPTAASPNTLPPTGSWSCPYGLLRVDLTNTTLGFGLPGDSRVNLAANTMSGIFMPVIANAGGSITFTGGRNAFTGSGGSGAQGERSPAKCDLATCKMLISVANGDYYMRAAALYQGMQLTVTALDSTGHKVKLKDAQILVDATGKAQDVLRRVQVRMPLVNDGIHADYGLQTLNGLCKAFTAFPEAPYLNTAGC